jgi:hypothetical protein
MMLEWHEIHGTLELTRAYARETKALSAIATVDPLAQIV